MDNPFQSPRIISYCTGGSMLERGLERAIGNFSVAAYVEIEAFAAWNLVEKMQLGLVAAAPVWTNLKTFPAGQFRNKVHGIIGGYPCQPFSNAGKRGGSEDTRHLYPFISKQVAIIRPVWCWFENVAAHFSLGFDTVYQDLHQMGYSVEAGIYSAQEVGAPHERKRLFCLAIRTDCMAHIKQLLANGNGQSRIAASQAPRKKDQKRRKKHTQASFSFGAGVEASGLPENKTGIGELGNTAGNNECRERKEEGGRQEQAGGSGAQLANTCSGAREAGAERAGSSPGSNAGGSGQGSAMESAECMANPEGSGMEGLRTGGQQFSGVPAGEEISGRNGTADRWPARPGQQQYAWEEPRIIEPSLGCSINGYNFREDLLRLLGNGVVEQTAEVAFIDLLNTHLFNLQK